MEDVKEKKEGTVITSGCSDE